MANRFLWRIILPCVFAVLATFNGSDALNCYVCQSVNGSDPGCEWAGADGELASSLLERDCKSTIGSVDGKTPLRANACMVLMGEYREKGTNLYKRVVSRKCTAAVQQWSQAKNVNCQLFDSEGHIPGEKQYITGCAEACFDDKCNGVPVAQLADRYRPSMKEYIETAQRADPKTKIRFPSVFAVEEMKRLQSAPGSAPNASGSRVTALSTLGPLLALLVFFL